MSVLAAPLNVRILEALDEAPTGLADLRRATDSPPPSTLRTYTHALVEAELLERQRPSRFPTSVSYALAPAGRSLGDTVATMRNWLAEAPAGPVELGSAAARSVICALIEGWSASIVRAIAARPLTLTDLARLITRTNYPALERRLNSMRTVGLVEVQRGNGRGAPYTPTRWLRRAVVPLAAAMLWERQTLPVAPQIGRLDVEATFLLIAPLMAFPARLSGRCRLAAELQAGGEPTFAGVLITVDGGRVASCTSRLEGPVDAWASGTPGTWMRVLAGKDQGWLEKGGDQELTEGVVRAIAAAN